MIAVTAQPEYTLTLADYLRFEESSDVKHEFHDGEILAMSGASPDHALITANVIAAIHRRLEGKPCRIYSSDLRIAVPPTKRVYYPDASVVCGPLQFHPEDPKKTLITNPTVIIEVLSHATEEYDRGDKFAHYALLPSLRQYVMVSQDRRQVEVLTRGESGWQPDSFPGPRIAIGSLGIELPLDEIYAGVELSNNSGS